MRQHLVKIWINQQAAEFAKTRKVTSDGWFSWNNCHYESLATFSNNSSCDRNWNFPRNDSPSAASANPTHSPVTGSKEDGFEVIVLSCLGNNEITAFNYHSRNVTITPKTLISVLVIASALLLTSNAPAALYFQAKVKCFCARAKRREERNLVRSVKSSGQSTENNFVELANSKQLSATIIIETAKPVSLHGTSWPCLPALCMWTRTLNTTLWNTFNPAAAKVTIKDGAVNYAVNQCVHEAERDSVYTNSCKYLQIYGGLMCRWVLSPGWNYSLGAYVILMVPSLADVLVFIPMQSSASSKISQMTTPWSSTYSHYAYTYKLYSMLGPIVYIRVVA